MLRAVAVAVAVPVLLGACKQHGETPPFQDPRNNPPGDPPPPDPCGKCAIGAGEICVQRFDGRCGLTTACVKQIVSCPDHTCSAACEEAYCNAPLQCQNRAACGTESPLAFTCYGP